MLAAAAAFASTEPVAEADAGSERPRGSGITGARLAELPNSQAVGEAAATLPAYAVGQAYVGPALPAEQRNKPTCMGHPVSPGGLGTAGDDRFTGTPDPDVIVAGAGDDVVNGRGAEDIICGGPGDDKLIGGRSLAKEGRPNIRGGDRLSGGPGDDRVIDRYGHGDRLFGGPGPDRLTSVGAWRTVKAGPGDDHVATADGIDESVNGGPGDDTIVSLSGGGYRGYAGGKGHDTLHLGGDGDIGVRLTIDGDHLTIHEEGFYILSFWRSPHPVDVDLAAGTVRHVGAPATAPGDTITYLDRKGAYFHVYGSPWDDRITSSDRPTEVFHSIDGGEGDDTLIGLSNVDYLRGEEGDDTLYGGDNDDGLDGGPGNDVLDGGSGEDQADGGLGADTCLSAEDVHRCAP
ncbi:calcium-binding protein [Nocardioides sp. P5_E3]